MEICKNFTESPTLVYRAVETSQYLLDNLKQVVDLMIEIDAFFAHHKNYFVAVIFGTRDTYKTTWSENSFNSQKG